MGKRYTSGPRPWLKNVCACASVTYSLFFSDRDVRAHFLLVELSSFLNVHEIRTFMANLIVFHDLYPTVSDRKLTGNVPFRKWKLEVILNRNHHAIAYFCNLLQQPH